MRLTRSLGLLALMLILMLVGTFENRFALAAAPSFTLSDLKGMWEGNWQGPKSSTGKITVIFNDDGTASYTVVDSDKKRTKYRWTADIKKNGSTIVSKARLNFSRIETYNLSIENQWMLLKSSYTINGKPWGSINLKKKVTKK